LQSYEKVGENAKGKHVFLFISRLLSYLCIHKTDYAPTRPITNENDITHLLADADRPDASLKPDVV
jgi:hypothetical protein